MSTQNRADRCCNSESLSRYENDIANAERLEEELNAVLFNAFENFIAEFHGIMSNYSADGSFDKWYKENV